MINLTMSNRIEGQEIKLKKDGLKWENQTKILLIGPSGVGEFIFS